MTKNELIVAVNDLRDGMDWRKQIGTLVSSWEMGLSDKQAAAEIGVNPSTLSQWLQKYPELVELREICTEKLRIAARKNIRVAIEKGHLETSKWYLERTDAEFSKKESSQTTNIAVIGVTERQAELTKYMERFTDAGVITSVESEVG